MRLQAKGKTTTLRTGKNTNMMQKIYQPSQSSDKNALTKQKEYFSRYQLYALAYVRL